LRKAKAFRAEQLLRRSAQRCVAVMK